MAGFRFAKAEATGSFTTQSKLARSRLPEKDLPTCLRGL